MKLALTLRRLTYCLSLTLVSLFLLMGAAAMPAYADGTAFVRMIHAAPDIGTSDIFVDGSKVLSSFPFGGATDYVRIPTGPHKVQVALIGKGPDAAVLTQTLSVDSNVPYTVAALGTVATGFSLQGFIDNNLLAPGQAKVRVYHLSPDLGTITVATGDKTVINGLSYKQASDYLTFPAGTYTFTITSSQANKGVSVKLAANTITSLFAVGMLNSTPALEFVTSQVAGIPNWPGTGSDPHATAIQPPPAHSPFPASWLLEILTLVAIATTCATGGLLLARRRKIR